MCFSCPFYGIPNPYSRGSHSHAHIYSKLLAEYWKNGWLASRVCRSRVSCQSVRSRSQRGALGQWYGTPVKSKYAARRKNRVAAGAENIVYPAECWAQRGRSHESTVELPEEKSRDVASVCPSVHLSHAGIVQNEQS